MAEENETAPPKEDPEPAQTKQRPSPWKGWTLVTTLALPLIALVIAIGMIAVIIDSPGGGGSASPDGPPSPRANEICEEGVAEAQSMLRNPTASRAIERPRILRSVARRLESSGSNVVLARAFEEQAAAAEDGRTAARQAEYLARAEGLAPCAQLARILR